jgi:integrase/recombinase XerC
MTAGAQKAAAVFVGWVEAWLEMLTLAGYSCNTIDCYRRDVTRFGETIAGLLGTTLPFDMELVGQREIDLIASVWETQGASKQTMSRRFSAVKGFAGYLCLNTTMRVDCSRLLAAKFPTAKSGRVPAAELDDVHALSRIEPDPNWIDLRNAAAFLTMACGTTTGETTALDRSDVDIDLGVATVRQTWLRPRPVGLSVAASGAIASYLDEFPRTIAPNEPLFQTTRGTRLSARSLQSAFRTRRRILGMSEEMVLSSLRHGAGRDRAERWRSPAAVGRLLGIDAVNTRRYFE